MFIDDVIRYVYPLDEAAGYDNDSAVKKLGAELDRIYRGGEMKISGISLTPALCSELRDDYQAIVKNSVDLDQIETISKDVSGVLKSLGFNVVSSGTGWKLAESADLTHLWKVGQPVRYRDSGRYYRGTVREVYPDYVLVDCPEISDHLRFEPDFNLDRLYPEYNFIENRVCEDDWDEYVAAIRKKLDAHSFPDWFRKLVLDDGHYEVLDGKILDVYVDGDMVEITLDRAGDPVTYRVRANGMISER